MKKGRPYYYIREIARVDGKPKVINQIYLGTIERIIELAQGGQDKCLKVSVEEFGALFLANLIEERVGLADLVDSIVPKLKKEEGPSVGEKRAQHSFLMPKVLTKLMSPYQGSPQKRLHIVLG